MVSEIITCSICGVPKPVKQFRPKHRQCKACILAKKRKASKVLRATDPASVLARNQARYQRGREAQLRRSRAAAFALRREVIEHYSGVCACCGESELKFLTIDHIYEDGAICRRETNTRGGTRYYYWVRANGYPDFLRVLCYNCNLATYRNGGICPHEEARLKLVA